MEIYGGIPADQTEQPDYVTYALSPVAIFSCDLFPKIHLNGTSGLLLSTILPSFITSSNQYPSPLSTSYYLRSLSSKAFRW